MTGPTHGSARRARGFTLIEIAIVVMVVAILLGYTVALFPVQQEIKQYREAERELERAIEHLIAFAQVNGRLPCPDTDRASGDVDGFEDPDPPLPNPVTQCEAYYGYLPARTLGMTGDYGADPAYPNNPGVLLDPWGMGYRYAVSQSNAGGDTDEDFVTANGIRAEGMAAAFDTLNNRPDLHICDDSAATGNDDDCTDVTGGVVVPNVAAVVLSLGKDRGRIASNIQTENSDNFEDGEDDKVFILAPRNENAGTEFDDLIRWIPTTRLFAKMIEAEQLP